MKVIINEENEIEITDWIFESVINRVINYLSDRNRELSETLKELKFDTIDSFSFEYFDYQSFKITLNAMRHVNDIVTYNKHMEILTRKSYRLFLKELKLLIYEMLIDSRNQDNLLD